MTEPQKAPTPRAEYTAFLVTNTIKLAGVIVVINEALFEPPPGRPIAFGVAVVMMAGAQTLDSVLASFFGRPR